MKLLYLALFISTLQLGTSTPIQSAKELHADEEKIFKYLSSFGYIQKENSIYDKKVLEEGLKRFQRYFKLPETGVADLDTLGLIQKPRCGVPDVSDVKSRYTIGGTGFNKRAITYYVQNYHQNLAKPSVDNSVATALQKWGNHAGLTFSVNSLVQDITLSFQTRIHIDPYPFDGPLGVLAHAFFPNVALYGGDVHYDNEESWNDVNPSNPVGIDFYSVTIHELGHSLGLGHSTDQNAIMYPYYQYFAKTRDLGQDDINGIKAIYGN